jgi:hypothetical protein
MATLSSAIRIVPDTLRTLAFGSISGTYAGIGTPFTYPVRIMHIYNGTDVLLTFSIDGINDYFVVPASSFILLDLTANMTAYGGAAYIGAGTRIYVKGSPSLSAVYLSVWYGTNG